jgi:hypothetical protein
MKKSLNDDSIGALSAKLEQANNDFTAVYPGETGKRQPVHTVYGGAHLFKSDSATRLGALARRSLDQFAPDFLMFAKAIGLAGSEQLPDSPEEDSELIAQIANRYVKKTNQPGWPTPSTIASTRNCGANPSKIFVSTSKTAMATVLMRKKTATLHQLLPR